MRSIEWLCCRWPRVTCTLNHLNFYISHCLMHLRNWRSQTLQIWCKGWMCKSQTTDDKLSLIGACSGHMTHWKFWRLQSYHWKGWTQTRQILYTYQIWYSLQSSNRMTYRLTHKRGVVMVTWLCGFVSDRWATCWSYSKPTVNAVLRIQHDVIFLELHVGLL